MSNPSSSPPLLNNALNDVNANMSPKTSSGNLINPIRSDISARKLIRSESTFGEDIFDESLHELNQLNQRHVLRQQWFRKNNLVSRLRRSTSTASNSSSSSSSGISSGVYSNCSANTSSFASSFSSSFATLSSLSESCDTNDPTNPPSTECDYPRILRRSSFKNKFSTYKPYYKPRRLSLQLLKGNLELPENFKFYSSKAYLFDVNKGSTTINPQFLIHPDKENSNLYTMANSTTKSNPSSPNKNVSYASGESCMAMAESDLSSSMQAQIVITSSNANSQGPSQPMGNNGQSLVRSKSLDDLNTLFCYSNLCPSSGMENNNFIASPIMGQQAASHYSSFNRIFCDFAKMNINQVDNSSSDCNSPQLLNYSSSGPSSHQPTQHLLFPDQTLGINSTVNNLKGMSYSSHEISNAGSNQPQSLNSNTNNTSLCDIDNVMKKISSLRV